MPRQIDHGRITSERRKLQECIDEGLDLNTEVLEVLPEDGHEFRKNPVHQDQIGVYRPREARKAVVADIERLLEFQKAGLKVPAFLEAGPRKELFFNPHEVRVAIVTTGGLAPGLHSVLHAIVKRHCDTYGPNPNVFGVYDSFRGLCDYANNYENLTSSKTEEWLDQGGCQLGIVRYKHNVDEKSDPTDDERIVAMADEITANLTSNHIDILYVIGGDGSLRVVHELAIRNDTRSIVGIPKTMDNDILWVWQSFGFDTAVEQATRAINTLRSEAKATRRVCLVELFGAESGFVAANSALASGHVDAVLIPEVFDALTTVEASEYVDRIRQHIVERVEIRTHDPHAVVVVAEGVSTSLSENNAMINSVIIDSERNQFINVFKNYLQEHASDARRQKVEIFINQPRHYIRAVPANAHDQIYCERLGALAVDNALAGYSGFMISQWLTEYVLVPTHLVIKGQKGIPINGMFWKQVVSSTGQPLSPAERTPE